MGNGIKQLRDTMKGIAENADLVQSGKSIEQKQRNQIKRILTEAMERIMEEVVGDENLLALYRVTEGLMVGIDNPSVGVIPIEIRVSVKNLDVDPQDEEEAYKAKLEEQAEKKARQESLKAQKIAASERERELKRQLREAKIARANSKNNMEGR